MALLKAYGLDPDETWEIDFVLENGRFTLEVLRAQIDRDRAALERETDAEKEGAAERALAAAEKAAASLEADLAAYEPGSGPVFTVGPLPAGRDAELEGERREILRLPQGKDRVVRDRAWSEEVVRWTVRGHRNLRSGKSKKEIPFATEDVTFAGETRKVVAKKTLAAYQPILIDLAILALRSQQLDEAEKNG